jgi:hypothetical protein
MDKKHEFYLEGFLHARREQSPFTQRGGHLQPPIALYLPSPYPYLPSQSRDTLSVVSHHKYLPRPRSPFERALPYLPWEESMDARLESMERFYALVRLLGCTRHGGLFI